MAGPANARLDDAGNRLYAWEGRGYLEEFYSVTTLIDLGVPKYLVPWAVKLVAELALADVRQHGKRALRRWEKAGRTYVAELQAAGALRSIKAEKLSADAFVLRWLKGEPDRVRDAAAARGSAVHAASEDLVLASVREASEALVEGQALPEWPDEIRPRMESFVRFVRDFRPRYEAAEATVYNRSQAYAGTLDAVVRLPAGLTIVDYKTGNQVYAEVALQLAAYARGEFVGGPDKVTEHPMPAIERAAVLHLAPASPRNPLGYAFRPVEIGEPVYRAFLFAREVARWRLETAKTVLGQPIAPDPVDAPVASLEGVA